MKSFFFQHACTEHHLKALLGKESTQQTLFSILYKTWRQKNAKPEAITRVKLEALDYKTLIHY